MAVLVSQVQPRHHFRRSFATIIHGPIPPSIEPFGARRYLQTLQSRVLRGGSAFSSSSKVELEVWNSRKFANTLSPPRSVRQSSRPPVRREDIKAGPNSKQLQLS